MGTGTLVDFDHVIIQRSRYDSTGRRLRAQVRDTSGSAGSTTLRRQGLRTSMDEMVDARKDHVEVIHARIKGDGYEVDAAAVAEAILLRLAEGGLLRLRPQSDD